ncbi:MAG TPA: glycosyltransferase [Ktedonobacterales bacterium]|nr:glycosyltransferase [Ktedonobacterales bacterium]
MGNLIGATKPATVSSSPLRCTVGIMAYNEASNIANAIGSVLRQRCGAFELHEVIVVASGCTDDTVAIVTQIIKSEPRVRLLVQERREGKASAINLFLAQATAPILIMTGADVVLKDGTLDVLLGSFSDETVGMVGAHPVPVNDDQRFLGHAVHLLWNLHDRVARESPKLGEVIAFRNVVPSIPSDTSVDEISIQALITQLGYRLVYEPRAIVYNRGPSTVSDFLWQRRRIYSGHLRIQQQQGYSASTMSTTRVFRALLAARPFTTPRSAAFTLGTIGLEGTARLLGAYDNLRRRQHYLWKISATTKRQITEATNPMTWQSVLVFHVVDVHQYALELGARGVQGLLQQIVMRMRRCADMGVAISQERNGTIIVLAQLDRDAAEQLARTLIADIAASPISLSGRPDGISIEIACGIIAFPQTGTALVTSVAATA